MSVMTEVLPLGPRQREENTAWVGMLVFIASWAMMFGVLFVSYGWLRMRTGQWSVPSPVSPPLGWPLFNTLLIALSSVALECGRHWIRQDRPSMLATALAGAALLGTAFLGLQCWILRDVHTQGMTPGTSSYASLFFAFMGLHAAHVLVGLGALTVLTIRAGRHAFSAAWFLPVKLWLLYWHAVGVLWGFIFVLLYVL